jgi:6-phosphogluconolactonase/glucosamine-6-phosphate isomerase/deaminase
MSAEPFELVPIRVARRPRLPGAVVLREQADDLIDALLAELFIHARSCVRAFGDFHLAISPSPAVEPFLRRLMYDLNYREFPWVRTRLWLVDDLAVGGEDPRSRRTLLHDLLVELSGIPPEQSHAMEADAEEGASAYEARLREHLGWREKGHDRLDFVMLALTPRGEVAGYRRGTGAGGGTEGSGGVAHEGPLVERVEGAPGEPDRVTMSMRLINASRMVAVVAAGAEVRPVLGELERSRGSGALREELPATRLAPVGGDLRWFVDAAACEAEPA